METKKIYCCACAKDVEARLTDGTEVYPHRPDIAELPFWKCDNCENKVGCHHKTSKPKRPLGIIPSKEVSRARGHLHILIDQLWKKNLIRRKTLYKMLSERLGYEYHTGELRTIEQCREVYRTALQIRKELMNETDIHAVNEECQQIHNEE